jgi:hypothetical protein
LPDSEVVKFIRIHLHVCYLFAHTHTHTLSLSQGVDCPFFH